VVQREVEGGGGRTTKQGVNLRAPSLFLLDVEKLKIALDNQGKLFFARIGKIFDFS
jgi:hypothetical protein